jgi:glycosyltransferase involved in cell wall biosynthesis
MQSWPRIGSMSEQFDETRTPTLAGATILQIVPSLREEISARTAIDIAHTLLQAGARAMVAGSDGPLVDELKTYGGEWISLASELISPFARNRNAGILQKVLGSERVDIVHSHCASGAAIARRAAAKFPVRLVNSLPDVPPVAPREFARFATLTRGHRVIAPSVYAANPFIERFAMDRERVTIIPRGIDTARFDPRSVPAERIAILRRAWQISPDARVVLTPGRVAPWNGQILLPDIARLLADSRHRRTVFLVVGENRVHRRYARSVFEHAKSLGVVAQFRITGHCPDMPAAFALSDMVVVPSTVPPVLGSAVAQAQSMGRPVVTSNVGVLPELVVVPPQLPEEVRTGWVATAGDVNEFARMVNLALALDDTGYRAMSARARQFAEYMFSTESTAAATRAVYAALRARDR